MSTIQYDDSAYAVRDDLVSAHQRAWERLSTAGSWLTGDERVKVMRETRHARSCATCAKVKDALSPFAVTDAHDAGTDLPENWVNMIHQIVADSGPSHTWLVQKRQWATVADPRHCRNTFRRNRQRRRPHDGDRHLCQGHWRAGPRTSRTAGRRTIPVPPKRSPPAPGMGAQYRLGRIRPQ